jgi:hypothetical protein
MQELTQPGGAGWWAELASHGRVIVVAWSVIIAAIAMFHYVGASAPDVLSTRVDGVASSIDVLDHGGPPLLVSDVPYHRGLDRAQLHPAGATDDQGIYLYLPLLGHWSGEHDPAVLMLWLFAGCFALLVLLTPLIVYAIFGSVAAAIVAPLLVLWKFDLTNSDLYWIQAWVVLLGLPGLLLAYRWWRQTRLRAAAALLIGLMVAASFATSIRAQAGLPVLIGGAGIVLLTGGIRQRPRRTWLVQAGLVAALAVAYFSVALGFVGVRAYRDSVVHSTGSPAGVGHPFWHPAYLGLGYLPNRYGIAWSDPVAVDAVQRVDPSAAYLGPKYERTLRHAYARIVENDVGFALRAYIAKARVIGWDAFARFWLLAVLLVVALALRRRPSMRAPILLALPALVLGAASPLLSIPQYTYELGWLGAVGAAWMLAIAWAVSRLVLAGPTLRRIRRPPAPPRSAVVVALVVVAAALFTATGRSAPNSSHDTYVASATSFAPVAVLQHAAKVSWRFDGALPRGWHAARTASELKPDPGETSTIGLHVLTGSSPGADALTSPAVTLGPGRYRLAAGAWVLAGGLDLSVSDLDTGAAIADADYSWLQGDSRQSALVATFSLSRATRIRVSLRNWTTVDNASSWVLWNLDVQQLAATAPAAGSADYYAARATPLAPARSLSGRTLQSWPFTSGTPQGWTPDGNPQQTITPRGLDLRTTTGPSAYQLESPTLPLAPGHYAVAVGGRVFDGGLEVGVLDNGKNAWITTQHFWGGQRFAASTRLAARFTLRSRTNVRVILSNWAPRARSSEWLVRQVDLIKLP